MPMKMTRMYSTAMERIFSGVRMRTRSGRAAMAVTTARRTLMHALKKAPFKK